MEDKFAAKVFRYAGICMIGCALGANQYAWNPRVGLLYVMGVIWFGFGVILK